MIWICIIITRGQMDDGDYIARHLVTIPCTIVARPPSFSATAPSHIRQFEELPCITAVSALKGALAVCHYEGDLETIKVNGHYRVNSGDGRGAAVAGVGFAILSNKPANPILAMDG